MAWNKREINVDGIRSRVSGKAKGTLALYFDLSRTSTGYVEFSNLSFIFKVRLKRYNENE